MKVLSPQAMPQLALNASLRVGLQEAPPVTVHGNGGAAGLRRDPDGLWTDRQSPLA